MRGYLKVLLCFPGINVKIGRFMLAVLCRMIQTAEWLLKDLNDNWGQLNGCWRYCFHLFLPPALHRYWTACQSADELSQLPSWYFMLCHCCKPHSGCDCWIAWRPHGNARWNLPSHCPWLSHSPQFWSSNKTVILD